MRRAGVDAAVLRVLVRRPRLWPTALRTAGAAAPRRWWCRPPFLPLPERDYVGFRQLTHTGDAAAGASPDELVAYLEWCAQMRRHRTGR